MTTKVAASLFLCAAILAGAEVSGLWRSEAPGPGAVTLTLQQTGKSLSGVEEVAGSRFPIAEGRIEGDKIAFTIAVPVAGRLRQVPVTGTVHGDGEIVLDREAVRLKREEPDSEAGRIARLASLIRLWGAIRFFHPYIEYRPIDWDAAFASAVEPVEQARSSDDFGRAISRLLSVLDDPETRVLAAGETAPLPVSCQCRLVVRSGLFGGSLSPSGGYYVDWESTASRSTYVMQLAEGVRAAIRTGEPVSSSAGIRAADSPYPGQFPSRQYRLLGLARFWNAVNYFSGYPESLERWDSALAEFIPEFEAARNYRDYHLAITHLAWRTHDGHAGLGPLGSINDLGQQPDIILRNIEGRIAVTASGVPQVERGDIILKIDGRLATDREKSLTSLFPASTPWYAVRAADRFMLAGEAPVVTVNILKPSGASEQIELRRDHVLPAVSPTRVMATAFGRLPSGLGYIDLTRVARADVDRAFDSIMDVPGIVFDLRGSVNNGAFSRVASRLTDVPVVATLLQRRVWHGPDPSAATENDSAQYVYPAGKAYRGRVAVLIDATAFSQAEHTGLFLEAATRAVFIGTPTSGTDGDLAGITLPGGVSAGFSGQSVRHADGRPLQRVGLIPDVWAEPTIQGLRQGKDEVLDKAVEVLLGASGK